MRKNSYFALALTMTIGSIAAVVAFNRPMGAQEPPPRAETKKPDQPLLEIPPPPISAKDGIPLPPLAPLPTQPAKKETTPDVPPPVLPKVTETLKLELPLPPGVASGDKKPEPQFPSLTPIEKPKVDTTIKPAQDPLPFPPPLTNKDETPIAPKVSNPSPPVTVKPEGLSNSPKIINSPPNPGKTDGPITIVPPKSYLTPAVPATQQAAVPANSPWSLQVDMTAGQTMLTATLHQKHAFKIACQSLDLQTAKGWVKATGKVQVTSEMMTASCENLTISLTDDRMMLEGSAVINVRKVSSTGSSTSPTALEMRSDRLDLGISDLHSEGKIIQTGLRVSSWSPQAVSRTVAAEPISGQWTPYGVLRKSGESYGGQPVWCLERPDGRRFERFIPHEGKSLDGYEGRRVAVYLQSDKVMSHVTHIAVP